jgi:hypothetical protein
LGSRLELDFSTIFEAVVWNTLAVPQRELLIFEIRNETNREVAFSAYHYPSRSFLWENLRLQEPWWVSLLGATQKVMLLQTYDDVQNPERKSLLAIDIEGQKLLWEQKHFSLSSFTATTAKGRLGEEEQDSTTIDLATGELLSKESATDFEDNEIFNLHRPFQYLEGNSYFETIKKFLHQNFNLSAVIGTEYLELAGLIVISYYVTEDSGLANYLLVMTEDGEELLTEKLGERLKGLGVETFFALSGYLFFVKNKHEFLSYRIL